MKEEKIDRLYKRIMKQDIKAIDDIESLDQAKELIKMFASQTPMILKSTVYDFDYKKYNIEITIKNLLNQYEHQTTYTDCEEYRREGSVAALERLLDILKEK